MPDSVTFALDSRPFRRFTRAWEREMRSEGARDAMRRVAEAILAKARARTPVGKTGRTRAGWKILEEKLDGPKPSIVIGNDRPTSILLEFGTPHNRAVGMLRVSLRQARAGKKLPKRLQQELTKTATTAARAAGLRVTV